MATTDTHAEQAPKPASGPGYDGFISYSHAADGLLAPRLQAALQRFAKPWWKRRALRIFRDESSLSANPHLWESITDALDRSGWFILLLSPDAAESTWVNQEVEYWVEHHDPQQIIPVLTQGSFEWVGDAFVSDAAPPALHGAFASLSEPTNDANWQGGTESSRWTSDAPYGVGSTQVTVTRFLGRKLDLNMEITHWDPAKTFGFEVREGPVPMQGVVALEPTADGGTEVIADFEGELGGFFKMAEGLVGKQLEKQVDTDFSALKLLLEADRG